MGQSAHYIDGNFLPPIGSRIKRAISAIFNGHAENPYLSYSDPEIINHTIKDGDLSYNCSRYVHPNSQGTVYILSGLRSTAKGKKYLFENAKAAQMSVVFGSLPVCEKPEDTLSAIDAMSKSFLTNPPFIDEHKGKPLLLMGHSTGGYEIANHLHEGGKKAENLIRTFDCIKIFSGFFKASFMSSTISNAFYPRHGKKHGGETYGQNIGDKVHIVLKELTGDPVYHDPSNPYPTHDEILYMADEILPRTKKILDKPFPAIVERSARLGRIEFIHGEKDGVADLATAKKVADHMKADFIPMRDTFHNPYTEKRIAALLYYMFNNDKKTARPRFANIRQSFGNVTLFPSSIPAIMPASMRRVTKIDKTSESQNLPVLFSPKSMDMQTSSTPN